jgi:hypothetical protein
MENLSLMELYQMKWRMIKENLNDKEFKDLILSAIKEKEKQLLEDTSVKKISTHLPVNRIIKKINYFK